MQLTSWGCFSDLDENFLKGGGIGEMKGVFSKLAEDPTATPGNTWETSGDETPSDVRANAIWECMKGPWVDTWGGSPQTEE